MALCTHNGARFVREQLTSVLAQSAPVAEIVVSDDASTDDTEAIVAEALEGCAAEVRVLRNEPAVGVTRNFEGAVKRTSGGLIALCDQDDVWHADKIRSAIDALDASGALLAHSDANLVDERGAPLGRTLFQWLEVSPEELAQEQTADGFAVLLRRNLVTGATVVFRRELLDAALPFPDEWVHDEWLAIVAAATGRVVAVERPTIDYRQHGSNQIGIAEPDLRHKISRVLNTDSDRNRVLARKFRILAERLDGLDVPARMRELAHRKAEFELRRSRLPASRFRRLVPVLRELRSGTYGEFASRRRADALRDVLRRR
ncbi:glycosyltransferase family 2 protein [Leifsonia sp. EB34]|uniref:glycosyltransferase family 2 protein n=1 Tax=Leifsonia sp. EB34 TaxID=3156303 RepID=UPI0035155E93